MFATWICKGGGVGGGGVDCLRTEDGAGIRGSLRGPRGPKKNKTLQQNEEQNGPSGSVAPAHQGWWSPRLSWRLDRKPGLKRVKKKNKWVKLEKGKNHAASTFPPDFVDVVSVELPNAPLFLCPQRSFGCWMNFAVVSYFQECPNVHPRCWSSGRCRHGQRLPLQVRQCLLPRPPFFCCWLTRHMQVIGIFLLQHIDNDNDNVSAV